MDYVPDIWLNALLDDEEADEANVVTVCEAAFSSSQAPIFVIQNSVESESPVVIFTNGVDPTFGSRGSAKMGPSKYGKLTAEQLSRIDRNRQIALALQMSHGSLTEERPTKSHRINFDDSGDEQFQDQTEVGFELNDSNEPNFKIRRRKLLTKSNPIGTVYPFPSLCQPCHL